MKTRNTLVAACAILALVATAGTAAAGDAVKASVTIPGGQPVPIIQQNGTGLTPGTYAIGTIQLFYRVQASQFPIGTFASFNLGLGVAAGKSTPATVYAAPLTLDQTGSSNLTLTPATAAFSVTSAAWTDGTVVTISIPPGVPNTDGSDLVGNLRIEVPGQNHLDTVTTIQVHIKLVDPTACLKLYDFITDEAFTTDVTSTDVNVNTKGKVTATNPFGQLSDNILVVNTCSAPQTFDVKVALDPWFSTNPTGNPGNAVFAFSTAGALDPDTFNIAAFGAGTPQGQSLSFTNISVAAGDMFLLTVHMSINKGVVWNGGASGTLNGFSAGLYVSGSGFTTLLGGVDAANPALAPLDYTVK